MHDDDDEYEIDRKGYRTLIGLTIVEREELFRLVPFLSRPSSIASSNNVETSPCADPTSRFLRQPDPSPHCARDRILRWRLPRSDRDRKNRAALRRELEDDRERRIQRATR